MGISIHALLAESDATAGYRGAATAGISIHALLAESDSGLFVSRYETNTISIHALLAESDQLSSRTLFTQGAFLSTLSLRRATCFAL